MYIVYWHSGKSHAAVEQTYSKNIVNNVRYYAIDEINAKVQIDASGNTNLAKFDSDIRIKATKFYKGD